MPVYDSHLKLHPILRSNCTSLTVNTSGIAVSNDNYVSPVNVACSTQPCPDVRSVIKTVANFDGIKIVQLNVRGLFPKRDQIEILLHQTNFHILFINESWIANLISEAEISVPGYTSIRNDRSHAGEGVIKNTLKFEHLKSFLSTTIESI